ncbi:hypothetical protein J2S43_002044 [Catenuloplanes nepalensis]|uniref:Secreted protein n=1 Tax=Catenuloplanes nepalensis TaxID=587533 RepID=A0ABT9MQ46_9ACTN|nr:hypothetical protein [Catenuloplanes nepalensis]MDP9793532.1 hypothetical protein [Catenuloplanes nepalensis]
MRRRHLAVPLLVLIVALSGCGGGPEEAADGDHDKQLAFAQCMRDNGVTDYEDPKPAANGGMVAAQPAGPDDPAVRAAAEKCRPLLPNGGEVEPLSEEERQAALTFAACMREHGVEDYPDPDADGRPGDFDMPEPEDPGYEDAMQRFTAASEACGAPAGAVPAVPGR